jgi:hypothetical protein
LRRLGSERYGDLILAPAMTVGAPLPGCAPGSLVTAGKLGIVEALDGTNGQWLWHKETVPQNVVASIDPKTGEKAIVFRKPTRSMV